MPSTLRKADAIDPESRLQNLIGRFGPELAALYTVLFENLRKEFTLTQLTTLLQEGRTDEIMEVVSRTALRFSAEEQAIFIAAGASTAAFLTTTLQTLVVYDSSTNFALEAFRRNNLELIQAFTMEAQEATRIAITDGIIRGLNPREQARNFRDALGLSPRQVEAVNKYRDLLNRSSLDALNRQLRDKRFDPTVRRAARTGAPLTATQIDKMVERYSARQLRWRAEMVARTEALRAVHEGSQDMYNQAIENGDLFQSQLEQEWHIAGKGTRDSHVAMSGQLRPFGVPFLSGLGNQLRFPGDPRAPAADVINCRCAVSTRITNIVL